MRSAIEAVLVSMYLLHNELASLLK